MICNWLDLLEAKGQWMDAQHNLLMFSQLSNEVWNGMSERSAYSMTMDMKVWTWRSDLFWPGFLEELAVHPIWNLALKYGKLTGHLWKLGSIVGNPSIGVLENITRFMTSVRVCNDVARSLCLVGVLGFIPSSVCGNRHFSSPFCLTTISPFGWLNDPPIWILNHCIPIFRIPFHCS